MDGVRPICDGGDSRRGGRLDFPTFVKAYAYIFYPRASGDDTDSQAGEDSSGSGTSSHDDGRVNAGRRGSRSREKRASSRGRRAQGSSKEREGRVGFRTRRRSGRGGLAQRLFPLVRKRSGGRFDDGWGLLRPFNRISYRNIIIWYQCCSELPWTGLFRFALNIVSVRCRGESRRDNPFARLGFLHVSVFSVSVSRKIAVGRESVACLLFAPSLCAEREKGLSSIPDIGEVANVRNLQAKRRHAFIQCDNYRHRPQYTGNNEKKLIFRTTFRAPYSYAKIDV